MKLNLGYSTSFPINYNAEIPEYSVENKNLIDKLSNKFNTLQIMFSKSKLTTVELKDIKKIIVNYKYIYIHASYQINMGADLIPSQTDLYNTGLDIFINEIIYAQKIKASGIVIHLGKNVKKRYDNDHIYNNMVKFIIELFNKLKTKKIKIPILLETPAGQGGEMCFNLNDFVDFIVKFKSQYFYSQLGICLDTCHIFQAGYDLNSDNVINELHKLLNPLKDKIKLIHLNDSFYPVGQHIDRHQQIGKGNINVNKLIKFIYPYYKIPMVLETLPPFDNQIKELIKSNPSNFF